MVEERGDYAKESKYYTPISVNNINDPKKILESQIGGFNSFIMHLPSVIVNQFTQDKVIEHGKANIATINYGFAFRNPVISNAIMTDTEGRQMQMTPNYCRTKKETYYVNLCSDIKAYQYYTYLDGSSSEKEEFSIQNAILGAIPCPVKANCCTLAKKDMVSCVHLGEDPTDTGGYFIIDGSEKAIIATKSVIKNAPQFHLQNGKDGIDVKCDITSQHGDNFNLSHYIVIYLMMDGSLIIRIDINREVTLYLPFQVLYKIFNINSDREIFNTILPNYDSKNNNDDY